MALRILQFGIVFAIGFHLAPASLSVGALGITEIPLSIHLKDPKDVVVAKGQSASLSCEAHSSSDLEIVWLHYDSPVPKNDSRRITQQDGSLYFPKVVSGKKSKSLTGEYRCLVKNNIGSILSNPAKLRVATFDKKFSQQPSDLNVSESQPAVLICRIHSIPAAHIQWEFNTKPLPHSTRYVPLHMGALLITKTHSSDAGLYRCVATNNILKEKKYSKEVELKVLPNSMNIATTPTFLPLDILPNTTALVGENVNLYCAVTGWPIPTVQWLNNDSIVISNSSVVQFPNVTLQDTGNYTCTAYNSDGRITRKFVLNVLQKPFFNITPTSKTYPPAKTVRLDCRAKGVPEPKIHWLKDGQPLPNVSRIRKLSSGLVFSHTFTHDSGIYQCIAANSLGKVWAAAQLVLSFSTIPSPPEDVQCRPFDDISICLTWKPPANVTAQAYTVYSFYTAMGPEIAGPDYLTTETHQLATGLNGSTNYTFYVRLYSNIASDDSKKVTCETGVKGKRDLQIKAINDTAVDLKWSKISSDVPCNGTNVFYKVQWRRSGRSSTNIDLTTDQKFLISGLLPGVEYEFRVISTTYKNDNSPWELFTLSGTTDSTHQIDLLPFDGNTTHVSEAATPENLEASPVSATVINLTWLDLSGSAKYYSVCYVEIKVQKSCEDATLIKSATNNLFIDKLEPNTLYEFKVRAHNSDDSVSLFSRSIEIRTPADVPSSVLDLRYKIINESTVCLRWQAPQNKNGKLLNYIIAYTPDRNWPLEKWISLSIPTSQRKSMNCWLGDEETFSTLLTNLNLNEQYTVLVRAASEVGVGNPTVPIVVSTNENLNELGNNNFIEDLNTEYNQKIGIMMGVTIAIVCIIFCISCILVRKRCLKNRALARARMAASNNYYPAVAHYASEGSAVQVRLEDPCSAEVHEIEHLVDEDCNTRIAAAATHLDTKGTDGFPNGYINGSSKAYTNGHVQNGGVNITENPRYYAIECNGHGKNKSREQYEEDSNSNLKTSKFQDLHRLFENSKLQKAKPPKRMFQCNFGNDLNNYKNSNQKETSLSSSEDDGSLNSTQLTCLDNSLIMAVNNHRRVSPILGPNG